MSRRTTIRRLLLALPIVLAPIAAWISFSAGEDARFLMRGEWGPVERGSVVLLWASLAVCLYGLWKHSAARVFWLELGVILGIAVARELDIQKTRWGIMGFSIEFLTSDEYSLWFRAATLGIGIAVALLLLHFAWRWVPPALESLRRGVAWTETAIAAASAYFLGFVIERVGSSIFDRFYEDKPARQLEEMFEEFWELAGAFLILVTVLQLARRTRPGPFQNGAMPQSERSDSR
jgi:hypothetical protein